MLAVAIGGFFGAMLRFHLSLWIHEKLHAQKFIATFSVNCLGSFLLGLFMSNTHSDFSTKLIAIGFLGAFTTFSTFSYEAVQLIEQQRLKTAVVYVVASGVIGIVFAALGVVL